MTAAANASDANRSAIQAIFETVPTCLAILTRQHPVFAESFDPQISLGLQEAAASLLCHAERLDSGILSRSLSTIPEQGAQAYCELFSYLVLAFTSATTDKQGSDGLANLYPLMARSTSSCLRAVGDFLSVMDASGRGADMLASLFNLIRLVILCENREVKEVFWNRTWPDSHRLMTISTEPTCVNTVS